MLIRAVLAGSRCPAIYEPSSALRDVLPRGPQIVLLCDWPAKRTSECGKARDFLQRDEPRSLLHSLTAISEAQRFARLPGEAKAISCLLRDPGRHPVHPLRHAAVIGA